MKKTTHQLTRSRGKDNALVVDYAEFKSHPPLALLAALNLQLEYAKPYDGADKAVVESSFRILQTKFRSFIAGYVHGDSGKREAPDYRREAALAVKDSRK